MNPHDLVFEELKTLIHSRKSIVYDIEFANRVVQMLEKESNFFFGEFSRPFLQTIALKIAHEKSYRELMGFYYEYVSAPLLKDERGIETPRFKLLAGYKGQRGAHLYTYVMVCTWRKAIKYFDRKKPGSLVLGNKESYDFEKSFKEDFECSPLDFLSCSQNKKEEIGWEILNAFFYEEVECEEVHLIRIKKIKKAFSWLQEKDRLVLQYLVIEDKSGLEAFELLQHYLRPKSKTEILEEWNDKQKQNTMSLWKTRALKHLERIIKEIKI